MKKIVCFVYQKERDDIIKVFGNEKNILFFENFDEITKKHKNSYVIVSLKMASQNTEKYKKMLFSFPENEYPILHDNDGKFSNEVLQIHWETQIPYHNYTFSNIIEKIRQMVDNH